jgi:hypothetical protein
MFWAPARSLPPLRPNNYDNGFNFIGFGAMVKSKSGCASQSRSGLE